MKLSLRIVSIMIVLVVAKTNAAEAIKKNLEKRVLEQELTQQRLIEQMTELALKTIDISGLTEHEFEQFQKQVAELLNKELTKQQTDPKHARSSSI